MNGHIFEIERLVRHRQDEIALAVPRARGTEGSGRPTLREWLAAVVARRGQGEAAVAGTNRAGRPLEAGVGD